MTSGALVSPLFLQDGYSVETVYVGVGGHLRRFKVCQHGVYVPGGLFRTSVEAIGFVNDRVREENTL